MTMTTKDVEMQSSPMSKHEVVVKRPTLDATVVELSEEEIDVTVKKGGSERKKKKTGLIEVLDDEVKKAKENLDASKESIRSVLGEYEETEGESNDDDIVEGSQAMDLGDTEEVPGSNSITNLSMTKISPMATKPSGGLRESLNEGLQHNLYFLLFCETG
ncbi:hypothetical protein ACLOJK_020091 [Asimina triloba]